MCGKYYTIFPDELGGFLLFPCFLAFFILPWYVCQRYIITYLFHNTKQMNSEFRIQKFSLFGNR